MPKDNTWFLLEMADRSFVSIRNVSIGGRMLSIGLQSNGIYKFDHVVINRTPPSRESIVRWLRPREIRIDIVLDFCGNDPVLAAEVHASWCMMRHDLLNVITGGKYGEDCMEGIPTF